MPHRPPPRRVPQDTTRTRTKRGVHFENQPSGRLPGESWEDYEDRVLARTQFSQDTVEVRDVKALEPDMRRQLLQLLDSAQVAGHRVKIMETRRSQERQEMLFQRGRVPGKGKHPVTWTLTSSHTPGKAVDVVVNDDRTGRDPGYAWLHQMAPELGFTVLDPGVDPGHLALLGPTETAEQASLEQSPAIAGLLNPQSRSFPMGPLRFQSPYQPAMPGAPPMAGPTAAPPPAALADPRLQGLMPAATQASPLGFRGAPGPMAPAPPAPFMAPPSSFLHPPPIQLPALPPHRTQPAPMMGFRHPQAPMLPSAPAPVAAPSAVNAAPPMGTPPVPGAVPPLQGLPLAATQGNGFGRAGPPTAVPQGAPSPPLQPGFRPGLLARMMPVPPGFEGFISPDMARQARASQLRGLGASLMAASGPSPVKRPFLANLGEAIQQQPSWMERLSGVAGNQIALQQAQSQMDMLRRRKDVLAKYPPAPHETPSQTVQRLQRMAPEFATDPQMMNAIAQALNAMGVGEGAFKTEVMLDEQGNRMLYRIRGTGEREPLGPAPPEGLSPAQEAMQVARRDAGLRDIANEYQQDTTPVRNSYRALTRSLRSLPQARAGNGPAQIEMTYAFITTIDQGIVKEGEVALVNRNAASTLKRARHWLAKNFADSDAIMPVDLVQDVANLIEGVKNQYDRELKGFRTHYEGRIKKRYPREDPAQYLPDLTDIIGFVGPDGGGGGTDVDRQRAAFQRGQQQLNPVR